jgi:hypothetical protein
VYQVESGGKAYGTATASVLGPIIMIYLISLMVSKLGKIGLKLANPYFLADEGFNFASMTTRRSLMILPDFVTLGTSTVYALASLDYISYQVFGISVLKHDQGTIIIYKLSNGNAMLYLCAIVSFGKMFYPYTFPGRTLINSSSNKQEGKIPLQINSQGNERSQPQSQGQEQVNNLAKKLRDGLLSPTPVPVAGGSKVIRIISRKKKYKVKFNKSRVKCKSRIKCKKQNYKKTKYVK